MPNLDLMKGYQRGLARVLLAALGAVEIGLLGWWAATGATLVFVLLQLFILALATVAALALRYRRFRRAYEDGIAETAVFRERTRLAEEMHDALGHELTVIALGAGALQVHSTGKTKEQAAALRRDVEHAVAKLRETVGLLHSGSEGQVPYEPTTETTEQLVTRTAASGAYIEVTGALPDDLPEVVERTAYRVVREGLTNATRHAPGAPIAISFTTEGDRVGMRITNPTVDRGKGASGSGIASLRRRVTLLGGQLTSTVDLTQHTLAARVPRTLQALDAANTPNTPPASSPVRSPLRATFRSSLIPAVIASALVLGFYVWSTNGATLEDDVFVSIAPGDPEAATRQLLPSRQSPVRLAPTRPHPTDWTCVYYTDGNFPLGMAAFEICYRGDQVVFSTDLRRERAL